MRVGRSIPALALTTLLGLVAIIGCGGDTPPQHDRRLRKAARVVAFRIHCVKDLWDHTSAPSPGSDDDSDQINAKVSAPDARGLVTVELTGPQLVVYFRRLDYNAYPFLARSDPLAYRMYSAIAPVIDKIQAAKPDGTVPEVTVDDAPAATPPAARPARARPGPGR
jgi:hypothetical protein